MLELIEPFHEGVLAPIGRSGQHVRIDGGHELVFATFRPVVAVTGELLNMVFDVGLEPLKAERLDAVAFISSLQFFSPVPMVDFIGLVVAPRTSISFRKT